MTRNADVTKHRLSVATACLEQILEDGAIGATKAAVEQALRPLKALRPHALEPDNERYREVPHLTGREVARYGWAPDRADHPAVHPDWRDRDRP